MTIKNEIDEKYIMFNLSTKFLKVIIVIMTISLFGILFTTDWSNSGSDEFLLSNLFGPMVNLFILILFLIDFIRKTQSKNKK